MIATYSILHNYYSPVVRYVIEKNPSMSEKDRFKLKRQMEAWKVSPESLSYFHFSI